MLRMLNMLKICSSCKPSNRFVYSPNPARYSPGPSRISQRRCLIQALHMSLEFLASNACGKGVSFPPFLIFPLKDMDYGSLIVLIEGPTGLCVNEISFGPLSSSVTDFWKRLILLCAARDKRQDRTECHPYIYACVWIYVHVYFLGGACLCVWGRHSNPPFCLASLDLAHDMENLYYSCFNRSLMTLDQTQILTYVLVWCHRCLCSALAL